MRISAAICALSRQKSRPHERAAGTVSMSDARHGRGAQGPNGGDANNPNAKNTQIETTADASEAARRQLAANAFESTATRPGDSAATNPTDLLRSESILSTPGQGSPQEYQSRSLRSEGRSMPQEVTFRGNNGEQLNGTFMRGRDEFRTTDVNGLQQIFDVLQGKDGRFTLINTQDRTDRLTATRADSAVSTQINRNPPYDSSSGATVRRFNNQETPTTGADNRNRNPVQNQRPEHRPDDPSGRDRDRRQVDEDRSRLKDRREGEEKRSERLKVDRQKSDPRDQGRNRTDPRSRLPGARAVGDEGGGADSGSGREGRQRGPGRDADARQGDGRQRGESAQGAARDVDVRQPGDRGDGRQRGETLPGAGRDLDVRLPGGRGDGRPHGESGPGPGPGPGRDVDVRQPGERGDGRQRGSTGPSQGPGQGPDLDVRQPGVRGQAGPGRGDADGRPGRQGDGNRPVDVRADGSAPPGGRPVEPVVRGDAPTALGRPGEPVVRGDVPPGPVRPGESGQRADVPPSLVRPGEPGPRGDAPPNLVRPGDPVVRGDVPPGQVRPGEPGPRGDAPPRQVRPGEPVVRGDVAPAQVQPGPRGDAPLPGQRIDVRLPIDGRTSDGSRAEAGQRLNLEGRTEVRTIKGPDGKIIIQRESEPIASNPNLQGRLPSDIQRGLDPGGRGLPGLNFEVREGTRSANVPGRQIEAQTGERTVQADTDFRARLMEGKLTAADIQGLSRLDPELVKMLRTGQFNDALKNPDFVKNITDAMTGRQGNPMIDLTGTRVEGQLNTVTARGDIAVRIPGLNAGDAQTRSFLADVGLRLSTLEPGSVELQTMPLRQLLNGLDPQRADALTKFLTAGLDTSGGKLVTLGQLDQGSLDTLRNTLRGQSQESTLSAADALVGKTGVKMLVQQLQSGRIGMDPAVESGLGSGAIEIGRLLNIMNRQFQLDSGRPIQLQDLVTRGLDGPTSARQDFIARTNPAQDNGIRTLLTNSTALATFLDVGPRTDRIVGTAIGDVLGGTSGTAFGVNMGTVLGDFSGMAPPTDATANSITAAIAGDAIKAFQGLSGITGDAQVPAGMNMQEYIARLPIDPVSGFPYDPSTGKLLDPATGRAIGDYRPVEEGGKTTRTADNDWDEKEKKTKKVWEEEEENEEVTKERALALILKARLKAEREKQEQELKEKKRKEEDEKRIKYVCKKGDTIQSVSLKQLRDIRTAPLIYRINKEVIPVHVINGKEEAVLHEGLVIWLPSPAEVRRFKGSLLAGTAEPGMAATDTGVGTGEKFATPEEELAAMFGSQWAGTDSEQAKQTQQAPNSIELELMQEAVEAAKKRKENIEKSLGTIAPKNQGVGQAGRLKYVVRLGDSLKSIAMKHPSVRDISLWKLIAEINDFTTETDAKGAPIAALTRGVAIDIPSRQEIDQYHERTGQMTTQAAMRARTTGIDSQLASKKCSHCQRLSVAGATLCAACGKPFEGVETNTSGSASNSLQKSSGTEAAMIFLEAAGLIDQKKAAASLTPPTAPDIDEHIYKPAPSEAAKIRSVESQGAPQSQDSQPGPITAPVTWSLWRELDENNRIMTLQVSSTVIVQLQSKVGDSWMPALEYEIGAMQTLRRSYSNNIPGRPVKMELPAPAAKELAQNDLSTNWKSYIKNLTS